MEVVRSSNISLWCRLGGQHIYVVVQVREDRKKAIWKLHKISKPMVQHGTYGFYFWDADDNSWEILANPPGGYKWMFERDDQEGLGRPFENDVSDGTEC